MTNREPNTTEFTRLVTEYYSCLEKYWKISTPEKLRNDLNRTDTDLVCFYELNSLRKHVSGTQGLHYNDFVKLEPQDEKSFTSQLSKGYAGLNLKYAV
jgi:hypothetical protein